MNDDVVERAASAIREHVEPSHPDTIDIIIGVDDAAKAALAALKPGDKVGDGCVVVPVEPSEEAIKSARKATALHASIRPKLRSIEDREKLERELLKVGISAAYAIDAMEQNDE